MDALKLTFEPYKEKVVFCDKFLSSHVSANRVTLDSLIGEPIDFLKMDIEGEEINALLGGERLLLQSENVRCAICAYHKHGDEEKIETILSQYGFRTEHSKGYMLFIYDEEILKEPELRRGIIRGIKQYG